MNDRPSTDRGPTPFPLRPGLRWRYHGPRPPRTGVVTVAGVIAATLFASSVPTPLYHIYQARWHFSPLILTAIYAVYALAALAALLLVGRMSDELGRRPVLTVGLAGLIAASIAFAFADTTAWLFAARALQGVATGIVLGTAGAALIDLHPPGDQSRAGLINGVASALGLALGAACAAPIVQYGPQPRMLPFAVEAVVLVALLGATRRLREPVVASGRLRLRPSRPHVPVTTRGAFAVAALTVLSSWSVAALLLSLGPQLAARLLATTSALPGGWAILAFAGSAGIAQMAFRGLPARAATVGGSLLLASGMGVTVASLQGMPAAFFAGLVATGAGFGVVFMGGLRALAAAAPTEDRATVMSAFYIVAYLSLSVPAVLAGLIVTPLGLSRTFRLFGLVVIALALSVGLAAGRMQRSRTTSLGQHPAPRHTIGTGDNNGGPRAAGRAHR